MQVLSSNSPAKPNHALYLERDETIVVICQEQKRTTKNVSILSLPSFWPFFEPSLAIAEGRGSNLNELSFTHSVGQGRFDTPKEDLHSNQSSHLSRRI